MRALVTGAAGFIGSRLTARLLEADHTVVGLDAFTPSYDPARKWANVAPLLADDRFELVQGDLLAVELAPLLASADVVFHLAGQPGVRTSWGGDFADHLAANVAATQRLLEACLRHRPLRFVHASSSSVYGDAEGLRTPESATPRPVSPYGVTKLAGEHLVRVYGRTHDLATVILRCFTVYGPRQRPDMAVGRLLRAALAGEPFTVHGDGRARRDFTYVDDVVDAYLAAAQTDLAPGTTLNVGTGTDHALRDVVGMVEDLTGRSVAVLAGPDAPGDARRTCADVAAAAQLVGWRPTTPLPVGLAGQLASVRAELAAEAASGSEAELVPAQNRRSSSGARPRSTS